MLQIKGNQTMKFGIFKKYAENETEKLVPDSLFFKKALYQVKASGLQLDLIISTALKLAYNTNKLFKTLHY